MSNFKEILERINSVSLIAQMAKTMKLISISKLTKYQQTLNILRNFVNKMDNVNQEFNIYRELEISENKNINDSTLLIPIGSNKGFCGPFNNNVYKAIRNYLAENINIMPIGKKIFNLISKNKTKLITDNIEILKHIDVDKIKNLSEYIYLSLEENKYSSVVFIYNKFISASSQKVITEEIKFIKTENINTNNKKENIIYESTPEEINNFLKRNILFYKILTIMYESMCSENASTMISMNKASDNADKIIKSLRTMYNQTRQSVITNEITEISAGTKFLRK